ncbi:MAG: putative TPP-requiring enzyme [Acidimicrobiales bacterium]|jgi:acetolactate synthase-1/2/3 large subunit|nr:putative TPP-requiring enzyme [Acidimicrobiales bacterium]
MVDAAGGTIEGSGGDLAVAAIRAYGVDVIFTLSGGHIFPVYDGAVKAKVRIVDTRHEQTATFAAEAMAKLTRIPGVAVLTAGPGVTNGISAITTARFNGTPLLVLGGRAPHARWGAGSLQELDHVPIVRPVTKHAMTSNTTAAIAADVADALHVATTPHRGPVFVDLPMDVVFGSATAPAPPGPTPHADEVDADAVVDVAAMVAQAERPVLLAGGDVWLGGADDELRAFVEALRLPTFANGQGRGCLPADHELAFSRARPLMKQADVVVVVGAPLDFRLSFGDFGPAKVVHVVDGLDQVATHATLAASLAGHLPGLLGAMAKYGGRRSDHEPWIARLRDTESAARAAEAADLSSDADPIHPARVYGELRKRLDRDAIVIGDGGDFVSFAGKLIDSYQPGCWLDPGPYGCLGTGLGYSVAARVAHPDRQVVALLGDGAAGFSLMDADTLVRHGLPVVMVVGNNGIWALEKHPMQAIYGYHVAAELRPGTRYDQVVDALGGAGETVERPADIGPALDRAFASGVPYLVNVLTDPDIAYPRSSNLA